MRRISHHGFCPERSDKASGAACSLGLVATLIALGLSACASPPTGHLEGEGARTHDALRATCSNPYELKQDCSTGFGATRSVRIAGREFKVAGSEDGRVVMFMPKGLPCNPDALEKSDEAFWAARREIEGAGIEVDRVDLLTQFADVYG